MSTDKIIPLQCRLFIALPVPERYREILDLLKEVNNGQPDFKWVAPRNLHVTVFFIGNILNQHIPEIEKIIKECVDVTQPFNLKYSDVILQGREPKRQMLWVRFEKNEAFTALSLNFSKYLEPLGVMPSRYRDPVPHITLARIKNGAVPVIKAVTGEDILFSGCELWLSNPSPKGVNYSSVYRYYHDTGKPDK